MTRRLLFLLAIGALIVQAQVSMAWLRDQVAYRANEFMDSYRQWAQKMNAHTREGQLDYRAICAWQSGPTAKTTGKSLPKLFDRLKKAWQAWKRGG